MEDDKFLSSERIKEETPKRIEDNLLIMKKKWREGIATYRLTNGKFNIISEEDLKEKEKAKVNF